MSSDRINFVGPPAANERPCCRLIRQYLLGELSLSQVEPAALRSFCPSCDRLLDVEPKAPSAQALVREVISVRTTSWNEVLEISPDILERLQDLVEKLKKAPKSFQTRPFDSDDSQVEVTAKPIDFGRYQPQELLGKGGFGEVYLAFDPELEREVAIKTVLPRYANGDALNRLLPEARAAARLNHPGIVRVFDIVNSSDGGCYIVMEYVDGRSLSQILKTEQPSIDQALEWTLQIALALQHAHSHRIIHRDLKPANVLIRRDGRALVADFGLAHAEDSAGPRSSERAGTPALHGRLNR